MNKVFVCKHEDVSSIPSTHLKGLVHACNLSTREGERLVPGLDGLA